jgi:hypothetical protein
MDDVQNCDSYVKCLLRATVNPQMWASPQDEVWLLQNFALFILTFFRLVMLLLKQLLLPFLQ